MQRNVSVVHFDVFVARIQRGSERTWKAGVGHRGHGRVGMDEGVRRSLRQDGRVDGVWVWKPVGLYCEVWVPGEERERIAPHATGDVSALRVQPSVEIIVHLVLEGT
jgi:hypothetical protein